MTKPQPIGANVAPGDPPAKDELSRLVKTIARQAAREAFRAFMEALESGADYAATPSNTSTRPEQAPRGTAGNADRPFEPEQRFLSVAEVAEKLDVSEKWVRRKIAMGDLPAHRVGRLLRVGDRTLASFLARVRFEKDLDSNKSVLSIILISNN
jgi:excisionase family DNA binding protein